MNTDTLKSILYKADPQRNSNYQERQVALNMAHKAMDNMGVSYASLGFSQDDAERIENQFSVSAPASENNQHGSPWWNPFTWGSENHNKKPESTFDSIAYSYSVKSDSSSESESSSAAKWDYKPACDSQGAVPNWDGWNGD